MALRHLFASYGIPEQLVSDNGPQFTSGKFKLFLSSNGVKHILCSPYHPSSNGAAERFVRTFKQALKTARIERKTTQEHLANFMLTYRSTPHATTGETPANLFFGRSLRTRLDLIRPDMKQRVAARQAAQKKLHDQHAHS